MFICLFKDYSVNSAPRDTQGSVNNRSGTLLSGNINNTTSDKGYMGGSPEEHMGAVVGSGRSWRCLTEWTEEERSSSRLLRVQESVMMW